MDSRRFKQSFSITFEAVIKIGRVWRYLILVADCKDSHGSTKRRRNDETSTYLPTEKRRFNQFYIDAVWMAYDGMLHAVD